MVVVRRLRDMVLILFIVGSVLFFMLHSIPGSPALAILGVHAPLSAVNALNHQLGFDRPVWSQYVNWIWHALHGNLGYSFSQSSSVDHAILRYLPPTLVFAVLATLLSVVFAVPLATYSIRRPTSIVARLILLFNSAFLAVPGFWLGLVLVLLLAVKVRVFPVSGYVAPTTNFVEFADDAFLPMVTLLAGLVPILVLSLRESLAGEFLLPYTRTARAKGAPERSVVYRHLLKNAFLPTLTMIGTNFGSLLGGVIIIETIFLIPGMGFLISDAINVRDDNLVLGIALVTVCLTVLANLIVDLLYAVFDPRVRTR